MLFTVSSIIISRAYPGQKQALAGGVFNAIAQMGNSVGLAVVAAIAASISAHEAFNNHSADLGEKAVDDALVLLQGYRSTYWLMFASMILVCLVSMWGLRNEGKVGKKDE